MMSLICATQYHSTGLCLLSTDLVSDSDHLSSGSDWQPASPSLPAEEHHADLSVFPAGTDLPGKLSSLLRENIWHSSDFLFLISSLEI